jgi:hypothetical protein
MEKKRKKFFLTFLTSAKIFFDQILTPQKKFSGQIFWPEKFLARRIWRFLASGQNQKIFGPTPATTNHHGDDAQVDPATGQPPAVADGDVPLPSVIVELRTLCLVVRRALEHHRRWADSVVAIL